MLSLIFTKMVILKRENRGNGRNFMIMDNLGTKEIIKLGKKWILARFWKDGTLRWDGNYIDGKEEGKFSLH